MPALVVLLSGAPVISPGTTLHFVAVVGSEFHHQTSSRVAELGRLGEWTADLVEIPGQQVVKASVLRRGIRDMVTETQVSLKIER